YDGSAHCPWITNRTDADTLYRTSGLNVSMPNCYPYQYFSVHASSAQWGTNVSPNVRSGLFWAPLERYSIAKRHLPTGHKLIPWVAGYVAWSGYGNNPPPQSDRTALIEHMRLRGSDGIYTLNSGISGLSDYDYKVEAHSTWRSMDWFFALPGQHRMLNLDTNKRAGTEWSGTARGNRPLVKVTNLGNTTATIAFPAIINGQKSGLPVRSPHISAGSHELLTYLDNHPMNQPFDGPIDTTLAANGWKGPGAGAWQIKSNAEPAAGSSTVASVPAASGGGTTWWKAANPGLLSNDRAVFSARVRGGADLSVVPVHIDTSIALHHVISASRAGPAFGLTGGLFTVTDSATGGPAYRATNLSSLSGRWYEIQILVDTAAFAEIWARDLTTNGQYLRLTFDNPNTPAIESITSVPISLGALNNLTVLNGWQITGSAGATLDALGMHLYPYVNGLRGPIDLLTEVTIPEPAGLALLLTATLPLYNRRRNNPPQ
ncbi:MAG TPA: hypothetical protein PJ982_14400, partial [Lacipirellulaceae bacterium]|nr:hypothetical protein [Lacipirellulaceae bacterium]